MPDYMTVCEQAARAAGATLLDWVGKFSVREKGLADLVTEADVASQETIRRIVLSAFPGHSLLGEEDSPANGPQERSEYRWVADPLDGTTNYVHGVPHFAVSLALERNGVPLVGAIFDPLLEECFCATAGRGAYVNGSRIQVSQVDELSEAVACAGLPPGVKRDSPDLRIFTEAALRFQAVRRTGSAALNFAYLAAGRFERAVELLEQDLGRDRRVFVGARGGRDRDGPRRRPVCPGKGPVRRRRNAVAPLPVARTRRPDARLAPFSLRKKVRAECVGCGNWNSEIVADSPSPRAPTEGWSLPEGEGTL